jgi:hypothetical protein
MTRLADYAVFGFCVLALPFVAGIGVGEDKARVEIATKCEPQPGEGKLLATHQDKTGVTCLFEQSRPGYGRAVRIRKATRT